MKSSRQAGFTLVEVVVVLALTVPVLLVIGSGSRAAIGSFSATERSAATTQVELKSLADVERALRFGGRESLRTPATRDDVRLRRASDEGELIALPTGEPRQEIEVAALIGEDGLALVFPRRLHRLTFVPEAADPQDGRDNDGDGLIDEGALRFTRGDDDLLIVDDIEQCSFELEGKALRIEMRCVRPGHGQLLQRTTLRHTVYLINP